MCRHSHKFLVLITVSLAAVNLTVISSNPVWLDRNSRSSNERVSSLPRVISLSQIEDQIKSNSIRDSNHNHNQLKPHNELRSNFKEVINHESTQLPVPPVLQTPPYLLNTNVINNVPHHHFEDDPCFVNFEGKSLSCYQFSGDYAVKLEQLLSHLISSDYLINSGEFNNCHEVLGARKRRSLIFKTSNRKQLIFRNRALNATQLHKKMLIPTSTTITHLSGHCLAPTLVVKKPFYLYNVLDQLRFIVQLQDGPASIEQCQPRATCR